jgi:hypothetical protein
MATIRTNTLMCQKRDALPELNGLPITFYLPLCVPLSAYPQQTQQSALPGEHRTAAAW